MNCGVERAFRVHVRHECANGKPLRPLILDVGCNDGSWGLKLLERIAADGRCAREATRLVLMEPQPDLARRLRQRTANNTGVEVIEAAAWTADDQTLSLHVPLSVSPRQERWASRTASLTREMALHQVGTTRNVSVRTVDLERLLIAELAGAPRLSAARGEGRWPVLLKLDIEASEYDATPHAVHSALPLHSAFCILHSLPAVRSCACCRYDVLPKLLMAGAYQRSELGTSTLTSAFTAKVQSLMPRWSRSALPHPLSARRVAPERAHAAPPPCRAGAQARPQRDAQGVPHPAAAAAV